uniref:Putative secreted protein n=1 Tax=Ixodes ricinus TaxID=34613 RepID=V5II79_IXORI
MKIILLAVCFAVGSVFSSDDDTGKDDDAWTSVCLESIGNCTYEDVGLTWHFNNIKKDCHPGTVCPTSKNRFKSEKECKQKCMHVEEHENSCSLKNLDISDGTVCWDYLEQRWYYDSVKKRCHWSGYFNCDENGNPVDPENSETGNNFFSKQECENACMRETTKLPQ